jgi:S1-C subfamily serine protease
VASTLVGVDVVDIVLVLLIAAAALIGLRVGALIQLFTFGGFWLGSALGALLAAALVGSLHSPQARAAVAVALVLGLAVGMGSMGRVIGAWSNASLRRHHLGPVDSVLGVAVAVVAMLLTAWAAAVVVSAPNSRVPWLTSAVERSDILRSVDSVLPPIPSVYAHLQAILSGSGLPSVFSGLAPPLAGPVSGPSATETAALAAPAEASTVKVVGLACGVWLEGSGFVVAPGLVATNAHVVAGESVPYIEEGADRYRATPVLYDPGFDMAVLRTAAPLGPPLSVSPSDVTRGTAAAVLGYPEDGPLSVTSAGVSADLTAQGRDIYNGGIVVRDVYELDATIRPGNSGGPLVGAGGRVVGMVFSRSTLNSNVGFALASPGVLHRVQEAEAAQSRVGTGACVQG